MNKSIRYFALSAICASFSMASTSCLEEAFPENSDLTKDQLANADKSSMVAAIPAYMTNYNTDYQFDIGMACLGLIRDVMTADLPVKEPKYDYFPSFSRALMLGSTTACPTLFWQRYYYLIHNCNLLIDVASDDPDSPDAPYMGTALAYRAMTYMDLVRLYEYKHTGVAELDELAESRGLYGITVPKITEKTTEVESRSLLRAPFYEMYRFIMDDLNRAELCLRDYPVASAKNYACRGVVYGLKARLWLEMGSRFTIYEDDLALQVANEDSADLAEYAKLGISTANDCFIKAAEYARKAINEGFSPVTSSQWYDTSSGFNTPNNAWMLCIIISPDNGLAKTLDYQSWVSFLSPEAEYGISCSTYNGYRMIDARLYSQMDKNDWRRDTWIDPDDVGNEAAYQAKYAKTTSLPYSEWKKYDAYAGFKWHPANGDGATSTNGNAVSIPLMRVEEMYFIEAEASAYAYGPAVGKQLIETFMNTYRMKDGTTYTCPGFNLDNVVTAIFTQKRIEHWAEGIAFWDYRRREIPIERGYEGTNHYDATQINSYPNAVAPWTTFYIPDRVHNLNNSIPLNPDPSGAIPNWNPNA